MWWACWQERDLGADMWFWAHQGGAAKPGTDRTVGTGVCKDLKRWQKALLEMVKTQQYLTTESICKASCALQDGRVRREENKRGAEPTWFSGWKMLLRTWCACDQANFMLTSLLLSTCNVLNCGVGEDSWESLGLQGELTSPFWRRSALGFLWKEWC